MSDTKNVVDIPVEKLAKAAEPLPTVVEEIDRLRVQVLDERLARIDTEARMLQRVAQDTSEERGKAWAAIQTKYKLGVQDSFNNVTGAITRAPAPDAKP